MKTLFSFAFVFTIALLAFAQNKQQANTRYIGIYEVPLVCSAAPEIGCGSRAKPVLSDLEKTFCGARGMVESRRNSTGNCMEQKHQ